MLHKCHAGRRAKLIFEKEQPPNDFHEKLLSHSSHTPNLRLQLPIALAQGQLLAITFVEGNERTSVCRSLERNCCTLQLYMDLGKYNLVGSSTSRVLAAFEGDAACCCSSAVMWDFDHCDFCATSLENRPVAEPLLDVRGLCIEALCVRSAFFPKGPEDRLDRQGSRSGSYLLSACRGGIDSFYC